MREPVADTVAIRRCVISQIAHPRIMRSAGLDFVLVCDCDSCIWRLVLELEVSRVVLIEDTEDAILRLTPTWCLREHHLFEQLEPEKATVYQR